MKRASLLAKRAGRPHLHYQIIKNLGRGSFGSAWLVEHKRTGERRCLKTVSKNRTDLPREQLEREFENMVLVDHPHVIRLFEYYEDANYIFFIEEALEGGTLLKIIQDYQLTMKRFDEAWLAEVFRQALQGIAYCHSRNLILKDLKAENLMLVEKPGESSRVHCVIIDLGLSECFKPSDDGATAYTGLHGATLAAGSQITMAPEVWRAWNGQGDFGTKCDIYSLGCVLFRMLSLDGQPPILPRHKPVKDCTPDDWLPLLKEGPLWILIAQASPSAQDLVRRMMTFEEAERPSAQVCLQHAWFKMVSEESPQLSYQEVSALLDTTQRTSLERVVFMAVAAQMATADLKGINALISKYENGLGVQDMMCLLADSGVPPLEAMKASKTLDLDGSGVIHYTELVSGVISLFGKRLSDHLWHAFVQFDKDGDGELSRDEVSAMLQGGQVPGGIPPGLDVDGVISELDTDGSETISWEEFHRFFQRTIKSRGQFTGIDDNTEAKFVALGPAPLRSRF